MNPSYNRIGEFHKQNKWNVVAEWSSMLFDVVEKETSDDFVSLHERILYLLANAYYSYRSFPQILDAP